MLGALATASIWSGALLQYLQMRDQRLRLQEVRLAIDSASLFEDAARNAARERGLSYGWLSQDGPQAELSSPRRALDASLVTLEPQLAARNQQAGLLIAARSRVGELTRIRSAIDHRAIAPLEAFLDYTDIIAALQDVAARRLSDGMIVVALPYEHVNALEEMAEQLSRIRGLTQGVIRSQSLPPTIEERLERQIAMYQDAERVFHRSLPDARFAEGAAATGAPAVREVLGLVNRLVQSQRPDALGKDASDWWNKASAAVNSVHEAAARERQVLRQQAEERLDDLEWQMQRTVAVLVLLGSITLALVLSTVGRILQGLSKVLDGLESVGKRRNFHARIDETGGDEFGTISVEINKLIAVAGSVVDEQEELSKTDPLTGVTNRRGFDQQLLARAAPGRRFGVPLSIVMIDVDHFKNVNDGLGHAAGDRVLQELAQLLRQSLRPDDVLARFGGEEFIALLVGCPIESALAVAEKLRAHIEHHDFLIGRPVTASFGVAELGSGQTPQSLIAAADAQLYAAKASGRNRVCPSSIAQIREPALG
jgi:diguanylate cyclase (GGDEF)-like protein